MESHVHTLTWAFIVGTDLGLDMARTLFENIWLGGLLLGFYLLMAPLKLPPLLLWGLLLFLVVLIMLCRDVLFL
jgi:hypothetical protein